MSEERALDPIDGTVLAFGGECVDDCPVEGGAWTCTHHCRGLHFGCTDTAICAVWDNNDNLFEFPIEEMHDAEEAWLLFCDAFGFGPLEAR